MAQARLDRNANPGLFDSIDKLELSERLGRSRERYFAEKPQISCNRISLLVESLKETEGQHIELRWAKAVKRILENIPVVIHDDELTVGSPTRFFRGAEPYLELDAVYLGHPAVKVREMMDDGYRVHFGSPVEEGRVSAADWRACLEAAAYLEGKTPAEMTRRSMETLWGSWYQDAIEACASSLPLEGYSYPPGALMFERVVAKGLRDVIDEAETRIKRLGDIHPSDDPEKLYFCQAAIIACQAAITLARRYAQLAREMAREEKDEARREDLEQIADVCEWVPEKPARNFHEAVQTVQLVMTAIRMENSCIAASLGRVDQYLHPFFKNDLDEGRITLERAADLIGSLVSFIARLEAVNSNEMKDTAQTTVITHFTLGGMGSDGEDNANELTYLFLHMYGLLRYAEPHVTLRVNKKTPRWVLIKSLETNRKVPGNPMYVNDDHVVEYMLSRGVTLEAARDWCACGCSQPVAAPARHYKVWHLNAALSLDLALHNGVAPMTGKRIGVETGDPRSFKTFDEVYEAFQKQHSFVVRRLIRAQPFIHLLEAAGRRAPLNSALLHNTIENGRSHLIGGSGFYPMWYQFDRGVVDTADSLTAMKKLVFQENKLTMGEFIGALDSNFAGERGEEIRRMCLSAPKYGNDIDEADYMVRDVGKFTASVITSEKNMYGSPYVINRNGLAWHYAGGKKVGALPNGHKAGEPLYDGSLSPMQGMDRNGPTAVLNSALKADFKESVLSILNQKFPLAFVQSPEALDKIAVLTESFLRNGGTHIQYNFVDKQVLLDAKKHPEEYRDLIVRVAGYSAYFVYLTPEVQDEIIARTEQVV